MLQPNRTKYRKDQKGRNYGLAQRGANVSFGEFGLKVVERGRLTARQIEAARRALTRHIKRGGRVWIRVFPDKPISSKPTARPRSLCSGCSEAAFEDEVRCPPDRHVRRDGHESKRTARHG